MSYSHTAAGWGPFGSYEQDFRRVVPPEYYYNQVPLDPGSGNVDTTHVIHGMSMAQPVQPYFDPQGPPQQYILPLPEAQLASGQQQGGYLAGPDPHVPYVPAAGWDYHSVAGMPSGAPGLYPATYGTGYNTFGACDSFPWMCAGVPEETARAAGGDAVGQEPEEPKGRKRKRRAKADLNTAPGQDPKPKRKPRQKAKDGQADPNSAKPAEKTVKFKPPKPLPKVPKKVKSQKELDEEKEKHSSEPYRATLKSVEPKLKVLWQRSSVSTSAAGGVSEAGVNSATEPETAICDMMDLNLSGVTHIVVKTNKEDQKALIEGIGSTYNKEHLLTNWDFVRRAVSNALFESEDSLYRITSFVYCQPMESDEASVILGKTPSDGKYERVTPRKVLLVQPTVGSEDVVELVCCPVAEEDALKKNLDKILDAVPSCPVEQVTKQVAEVCEARDSATQSGDESSSGDPSLLLEWVRSGEKGHEGIFLKYPGKFEILETSSDKLVQRPHCLNGYTFYRLHSDGMPLLLIPLANIHVDPMMREGYVVDLEHTEEPDEGQETEWEETEWEETEWQETEGQETEGNPQQKKKKTCSK